MKTFRMLLLGVVFLFCQNAFAQPVNSSVTIKISNGNYVVSGVMTSEALRSEVIEKIKTKLIPKADFSRLTVEPSARYFKTGWQAELDAALLKIKSWKSGVFIFSNQKREPVPNYPPVPAEIADARFLLTDGQKVSIKDYPNKVVILFLFATWCKPCLEQAELLSQISSKINSPNLEIIALDVEDAPEDKADLRKFIARNNYEFKFGWANKNVVQSFTKITRLQGVPQVLLTVNGRLRGIFTGGGKYVNRTLEETILKTLDEYNL